MEALEKEMAIHSSILAWKTPRTEEPGKPSCDPQKSPDTPGSPEGNTEGPGTASSEPLRQTQRSPEGPRHLHRIPRLSEAPWEVP